MMSKAELGLGGAPDISTFVNWQIAKLKQREQTFESVFDFMFMLSDNVFAEHNDGNKIFRTTYGECRERICDYCKTVSSSLSDFEYGSLVGLYMDNRIEWIELFWALLRCGYVPLLMNKRLPKETLDDVIRENNVCAVISDGQSFDVPTLDYTSLCVISGCATEPRWADSVIFMSSGTSSNVKLCVYSGEKICNQIYNSATIVKKSKEIRTHVDGSIKQLTFLPFYHVFGFLACYMWFAFFARTFVFLSSYNSDTILKTVRKHKVTHIFAVPMLWTKIETAALKTISGRGEKTLRKFRRGLALSKKLGKKFSEIAFREVRENIFGDSIRFLISGGGNIPAHTLEFFNGIGYHLANGFGMTEVGITSVELSRKASVRNSGSLGIPFDSVKYRSENGELSISGSSMASYIISGGTKRELSADEWFRTEDLAEERNGRWYLNGRRDDMVINSSGENISPQTVESRIAIDDGECALLAIPSEDGSTRSCLIVSLASKRDEASVREEIAEQLRRGDLFRSVDDIRITYAPLVSGTEFKLNRKRLRNDIMNGKITFCDEKKSACDNSSDDEIRLAIVAIFEKVLSKKLDSSQYASNFFYDLGGSSLAYFELVEEVKVRFGIDLLSGGDMVLYSVNDVCDLVHSRQINL